MFACVKRVGVDELRNELPGLMALVNDGWSSYDIIHHEKTPQKQVSDEFPPGDVLRVDNLPH